MMSDSMETEPLPPGITADEPMPPGFENSSNGIHIEPSGPPGVDLDDPGTPLENEAHDSAATECVDDAMGTVDQIGEESGGDVVAEEKIEAEAEEDDEDEDEDDDIEITIGELKNNVTFKPGQGAGRGAVGAKPTSKLDIDATAIFNGAPIFDVDMSSLEDKPWRKPGADVNDYFNYGFTEETWTIYCERQKKLRAEFGSAAQANKAYFSQPIQTINQGSHSQQPQPVPTLENRTTVKQHNVQSQPQIINLVPASMKQEQPQQILRTVAPVPSAVKPAIPQVKTATVLTPAVPTPAVSAATEAVSSAYDAAAALYDSEPSSPGTPRPHSRSDQEDSNPPPITPRTTMQPTFPSTAMTTAASSIPTSTQDMSKMLQTVPPTSANFPVPNLSMPPPRVMAPTNLPPPMARFGHPPPMFTSLPPPGFGNPPPTNIPPPGFGNPPPPGMPPHHFASGPFGFPPPMRPQMQGPPRFGPPPGTFGGFDQQPIMSRPEAHSPASYSDRSSESDDGREGGGSRFEPRYPPGSGPPGTKSRTEHRRSRSPYSSSRHSKYSSSHGRHRSRSPLDRDSDKERDRGSSSRRGGRDDDDKKKRGRREESSLDKKKSSSKTSRADDRSSSTSKKRKRSKERKD